MEAERSIKCPHCGRKVKLSVRHFLYKRFRKYFLEVKVKKAALATQKTQ